MSDGPHKSLPMRSAWKRAAEFSDVQAYTPKEVGDAIVPALDQDCRVEINPEFLRAFVGMYHSESLFPRHFESDLEGLIGKANSSLERAVIDNAILLAANGRIAAEAAVEALSNALTDRAARGARQVEEHYLRKSTRPRALNVRARFESGIALIGSKIVELARKALSFGKGGAVRLEKQQGLEDGVSL
jgi:hypothetical protein